MSTQPTILKDELRELAERVEAATGPDREIDREVALALGWQTRKVTGLGLNGRTPGRIMWVAPHPPFTPKRDVPRFSGPRMRPWTIAALRARASIKGSSDADL